MIVKIVNAGTETSHFVSDGTTQTQLVEDAAFNQTFGISGQVEFSVNGDPASNTPLAEGDKIAWRASRSNKAGNKSKPLC